MAHKQANSLFVSRWDPTTHSPFWKAAVQVDLTFTDGEGNQWTLEDAMPSEIQMVAEQMRAVQREARCRLGVS